MFREDQFFFAWYGKKFKKVLNCFNHFFVQDGSSYKILEEHGFGNITLSGDTRLDRVIDIVKNSRELPLVEQFTRNSQVLVAGSTWKKDEEILFRYFKEKDKPFKMIVAPHEVHASNIERIREELEDYSTLPYSEASDNTIQKADILIIDSIGLLASLYRYANLAYIGGGFGKGIHNLLEAATWGIPVIFGPNHQKFKEATGLIKKGGGFSIMDYYSLEEIFNQLLQQPEKLTEAGKKAERYIKENAGATEQVIQNISL
jgi:3-deoxy-D-manno-octulosonic-acid transferase